MSSVEGKLIEMCTDSKFKSISSNLKLIRYQYKDYCENKDIKLVDEMIELLLECISNYSAENQDVNPINEDKFKSKVSLAFYKFLVNNHLTPKTANDYVKRVNQVCNIDDLINGDVQAYIDTYTIGEKKEENKRLHNAPSCALKKFLEFKKQYNI